MIDKVSAEFAISGVYMPPLLVAAVLGAMTGLMILSLMNRFRISRYFKAPSLVSLSLMTILTILYDTFLI
ncbi:DUF1656 domain-containing protein [Roseibium aggregatum]|uniref:DUF1656 domain-containing protein n=1 Tax=Roseibium aggregatum TaxID=187304 RepID=UPI0025AD8001|nr:DUF1656 domain-containing protein [Roseibium aggregatum]WJS05814.1 DUF1656 domain-containing protein [Roseibium aggregatum]